MSCCCIPRADTNRFFSRLAGLHRLRFRWFGFEKSQRQLIAAVQSAGIEGASLLEVGCGVGHLHRHLLTQGAWKATGVDLSVGMLEQARREALAAGLEDRTIYYPGDFVELAPSLEEADIAILDKVVCCYPDPETLLNATLDRTRRAIALTYPRDRRLTRAGVAVLARLLKLAGSDFRPWVHDPRAIRGWIEARGFQRQEPVPTTAVWQTELYLRPAQ